MKYFKSTQKNDCAVVSIKNMCKIMNCRVPRRLKEKLRFDEAFGTVVMKTHMLIHDMFGIVDVGAFVFDNPLYAKEYELFKKYFESDKYVLNITVQHRLGAHSVIGYNNGTINMLCDGKLIQHDGASGLVKDAKEENYVGLHYSVVRKN